MDFCVRFLTILLLVSLSDLSERAVAAAGARSAFAVQTKGSVAEAQERATLAKERQRIAEEAVLKAQKDLEDLQAANRGLLKLLRKSNVAMNPLQGEDLEEFRNAVEEFKQAIGEDPESQIGKVDRRNLRTFGSLDIGVLSEDQGRIRDLRFGSLLADSTEELGAKRFLLGDGDHGHWIEGKFALPEALSLHAKHKYAKLRLTAVKDGTATEYLPADGGCGLSEDGSFRIKVGPRAKKGWLKLGGGNLVFTSFPKYSIAKGVVTLSGDFSPKIGGSIRVKLKDREGQPVGGWDVDHAPMDDPSLLYEPDLPSFERAREEGRPKFKGSSTFLIGPMLPSAPGGVKVRCAGYVNTNFAIDPDLIRPNETGDMEIVLVDEVPIEVVVVDPTGKVRLGDMVIVGKDADLDSHPLADMPMFADIRRFYGRGPGTHHVRVSGAEIRTQTTAFTIPPGTKGTFQVKVVAQLQLGVHGKVVWADGTPMARARVWVRPFVERTFSTTQDPAGCPQFFAFQGQRARTVRTDDEGRFRVAGIDEARFCEVLASATPPDLEIPEGLSKAKTRFFKRKKEVLGVAAPVPPDGDPITLVLGGAPMGLHGRVVDSQGIPVQSFQLKAYTNSHAELLEQSLVLKHIRSLDFGEPASMNVRDGAGRFSLPALQSGEWCLRVSAEGFVSKVQAQTQPGEADIVIVMERTASMRGRVLAPDGSELLGVQLTAKGPSGLMLDQAARAEFDWQGLAPGEYEVWARAEGFGCSEIQSVNLVAGEASRNLDFKLQRLGSISGQIGARLRDTYLAYDLLLVQVDSGEQSAEVNEDGTFLLHGVDAGSRELTLVLPASEEWPEPMLLGYKSTVEVPVGGTGHVLLESEPDSVLVEGLVLAEGDPASPAFLYYETSDQGRIFAVRVRDEGYYSVLLPPRHSFNVFLGFPGEGQFGDEHYWLSRDWASPSEPGDHDWRTATGSMRVEYVDEAGAPFAWFQDKPPTGVFWYPDREVPIFGLFRSPDADGLIHGLLPGGSYGLATGSRDAQGRIVGTYDTKFTVPLDGSIGLIKTTIKPLDPVQESDGETPNK